jgi:SRSO17 transposase
MTEEQLDELGPALDHFLRPYLFCCSYTQTFAHLSTYCKGLLSELPRKSVEPIALASGCAVRTLQEFLKDHLWQHSQVRDQLQGHVAEILPALPDDGLGTIGLIDETSAKKSGNKTPGVGRQYLGCVGKVDNGIVTVHLGLCHGTYKALLDAELFLPEEWADDRTRCRAAGIPDTILYRPKWQIALEQLDRARAHGLVFDGLTFDEGYGKAPGFVVGLDERQQLFVGEVPKNLSCLAANGCGRRPAASVAGRRADEVVRHSPAFLKQAARKVRLGQKTQAGQVWEVKAARVWQMQEKAWSQGTYWLIWARNVATGEEKYFLSNAPENASLVRLLRIAFCRWNVEHGFRVCKSELGFSHYEGRNYTGLMRHQTLCLLMLSFVAEHTQRLRGEKPGGDDGAGVRGAEPVVPGMARASTGHGSASAPAGDDCLPPASQPGGPPVPAAASLPAQAAA